MSDSQFGNPTQIFIDDSDPNVKYTGDWLNETGIATAERPLINAEDGPTPLYGTLHRFTGNGDGILSYIFQGRSVTAFFSNSGATFSCLLDNVPQNVTHSLDTLGRRVCSGNNLNFIFTHNLTILVEVPAVDGTLLSFDGLFYSPSSSFLSPDLDAAYIIPNNAVTLNLSNPDLNMMQTPGDTLTFEFDGVSMGVYSSFQLTPRGVTEKPSTISYVIDQGLPITVEITNPIMNGLSNITSQLIIQTPVLSPGPHSFQMTFVGPDQDGTPLTPDRIITQAVNRSLDIVPQSGSNQNGTIGSQSRGGHHHLSNDTIIAISVSIAALLILIGGLWFWRRLRSRKQLAGSMTDANPPESQIIPFETSNENGSDTTRIVEYRARENNKYREAFGALQQITAHINRQDPITHLSTSDVPQDATNVNQMAVEQQEQQPRRYQIHHDAGQILIMEPTMEDGDEVVSLPPLYNTIGRMRPASNPPGIGASRQV